MTGEPTGISPQISPQLSKGIQINGGLPNNFNYEAYKNGTGTQVNDTNQQITTHVTADANAVSNAIGNDGDAAHNYLPTEEVRNFGNNMQQNMQAADVDNLVQMQQNQLNQYANRKPTIDLAHLASVANKRVMGGFDFEALKQEMIENVKIENAWAEQENIKNANNPDYQKKEMLETVSLNRIAIHLINNPEAIQKFRNQNVPDANIENVVLDLAAMDSKLRTSEGRKWSGHFAQALPVTGKVAKEDGTENSAEEKKEPEITVSGIFDDIVDQARRNALNNGTKITRLDLLQAMYEVTQESFIGGDINKTLRRNNMDFESIFPAEYERFTNEQDMMEQKMMDRVTKLMKAPLDEANKNSVEAAKASGAATGKAVVDGMTPVLEKIMANRPAQMGQRVQQSREENANYTMGM